MSIVKKIGENMFAEDSPWQFRLLAIMIVMFFGGGLLLDTWASQIPFPELNENNHDLNQLTVEFTKTKHQSLTDSAALLYDFAKIVLGALIASVTQSLKISKAVKSND